MGDVIMNKKSSGFTLIELMVVVIIVAIFASVAIPSYQQYVRRANASLAEQEMLRFATLLERHKARSFSYKNFATTTSVLPVGATGTDVRYNIAIVDGTQSTMDLTDDAAAGRAWAMRAESVDTNNFSFLLTSTGVRCKNKSAELVTFASCGNSDSGSEPW